MAGGGYAQKLLVFVILFSLVYSFGGYAWSSQFPDYSANLPSGLTAGSLLSSGIAFTDVETHNVTETDTWVTYDLVDYDYRVRWTGDFFYFRVSHVWVEWALGGAIITPTPYNETWVIGNYSDTNKFTEITIAEGKSIEATLLFTVHPDYADITDSITNHNVTITIGRGMEQINTGNWWDIIPRAVGWFLSTTSAGYFSSAPSSLNMFVSLFNTILIALAVLSIIFFVRGV